MEQWRNELYHHGIKGQKWGVRRFQNEDGTRTREGEKRYGIRDRMRTRHEYGVIATTKEKIRRAKNTTSLKRSVDELVGAGAAQTSAEMRSKKHEKLKEQSNSKFFKNYHDVSAKNEKSFAVYYNTRKRMSEGQRFVNDIFGDASFQAIPYTNLSGRTTTVGAKSLDMLLTGGLAGATMDQLYKSGARTAYDHKMEKYAEEYRNRKLD